MVKKSKRSSKKRTGPWSRTYRLRCSERQCSVRRCRRPVRARGLCVGHYQRLIRGIEVDASLLRVYVRAPKRKKRAA